MSPNLSLSDLIAYTDWQRQKWYEWLRKNGDSALAVKVGPGGDGRFNTVADLVKHIFSAEKRYIDRLSTRPVTDTASMRIESLESLFDFGRQSRADLNEFLKTYPAADWDRPQQMKMPGHGSLTATPRKIVTHVLLHEIRHWAQIATLLRLNGLAVEMQDFLFSPVLGGQFEREAKQSK